jgi:HTH-type transcriptional regulator / antitoxin MqsA
MPNCHICGSTEFEQVFVDQVFTMNGNYVVVEHIPARVCKQCGEKVFSREVTEKVRKLLHGEQEPVRRVEVDVFDLAQV